MFIRLLDAMKFSGVIFFSVLAVLACPSAVAQQKARIVDLAGLQNAMKAPGTEVKVINFWATWCAPCIKELPLLEKLGKDNMDISVMLVSLDLDLDPNPEKVHRFVQRKKLQSPVLILDAGDPNIWIDKIDSNWSGALPATLVVNTRTGKRAFVERELHEGDLEKLVAEVR
jgi:thiol-disulfide isomerase/thioredoxin